MYLKILRGGKNGYDPKNLSSYLVRESAAAEHVSSNLFVTDHSNSSQVADAFDRHHQTHAARSGGSAKRIKRPLVHIIARAAPQDGHLASEVLQHLSKRVMESLGLDPKNYPYLAQSHTDDAGVRNHIHIIASRISTSGDVWYGRREGELCWKVKTALEKEFDLHRTQTMDEFKDKGTKTVRRTEAEQQLKRRGIVSNKEAIAAAIIASLEDSCGCWDRFEQELRKYQVKVEVIERPSGRNGVTFALDGRRIPGSRLGRGFSYAQLRKTLKEVREGRVQSIGKIGLKIEPAVLEKQAQSISKDSSSKNLDFDQSQLEDLRKVERGKYPDLSAQAASIFKCYAMQRRSVVVFIICLLATRSMVAEYKSREAKDIVHTRKGIGR